MNLSDASFPSVMHSLPGDATPPTANEKMSTEEIRLVLGPMTVAVVLNTFLFGICFNQFVTYYNSDYRDRLPLKLFVTWELIIDTVQTAVSIYMLWLYFVENYLNPNFLETAPWPFTAIPIFTSLSSCPIQLFLSWRVFRLSKSWALLGFLVTLSTAQTVLALITGATAVQEPMLEGGLKFIPIVDSWLGVTVATDLAISASLTFYLSRIKTGFKKSDYMITQLMRSAIETAAFATIFSIAVLIVFTVIPDSTLSMVFSLPIGRIYTNTLLMTLNGRQKLRDDLSGNYESFPSRHRNATVHIKVSRDTAQDSYALGSLKAQQNAMENDERAHTPKTEEGIAV